MIEASRFEVLEGEVDYVDTLSQSGQGQRIAHCLRCRLALWSQYGGNTLLNYVRVGTLDFPDTFKPDIHIYTAAKQRWVILPEGTPAAAEHYNATELWPSASLARRNALFPGRAG